MPSADRLPEPGGTRLRSFHELMQFRVQRILMISSLYDSFIMSEEGQLQETLLSHFIDLNLSSIPDLIRVSSGAEALDLLGRDDDFDLVISSLNTSDGDAASLCRDLRAAGHRAPVIGLAYTNRELHDFVTAHGTCELQRIFLWQGDVRILLAIVMQLEDRLNAPNDTGVRGVPGIIVVEDNRRFYSSFLPAIYTELFNHTDRLLSEDLNLSQKMMRMRARPKVLLCETYEEAWNDFERYGEQILGVISDFEFPREGELDKRAGLDLCRRISRAQPGARIVLQSSNPGNRRLAEELEASFLLKGSAQLLQQLRSVLVERFGFGDFVFRTPDRSEVARASDLRTLAKCLRTVPGESIAYHASRNHFSNWLKARTDFALAERLRARSVDDFEDVEALRDYLLEMIAEARLERQRTVIAQFERDRFEPEVAITRVGAGSLGGKARGVAFANRLLRDSGIARRFPAVDVYAPPSVVVATQIFDEYLEHWGLRDFALDPNPDEKIVDSFLEAPFPRQAVSDLRAFLQRVKYPLAVRSSSLLEDSLSQPFAGVYQTFMLPNNDPDLDVRWRQLVTAIKRVYASVFRQRAKDYLSMTSFRLEEEKMAVMIQALVGRQHEDRFYPDFAGVARSYNFYPEPGHAAEDGVAVVALGLGRSVVTGSPCLSFCPKYPRQTVTFSTVDAALKGTQREFWALDLSRETRDRGLVGVQTHPLEVAERDGTLAWIGSTYSPENDVIVDGISRPGVRLISFAQVLKHGAFPLAELLQALLRDCSEGTGAPVEIEFAGNLGDGGRRSQLAFLQLRPLALSQEQEEVAIGDVPDEAVLSRTTRVLGNGRLELADVVVVDNARLDRMRTPEIALEVARFDAILRKSSRPYLLIGAGRWGSADPNLGVPVTWNQIAGARVIVEAGFQDMKVEPSQGTHFFQNLTSSNVGYFTVNPEFGEGVLDWGWLAEQEAADATEFVRHLRLPRPLVVKMSGMTGEGVILKPGAGG